MLYKAKADASANQKGAAELQATEEAPVVKRVCSLMARALHPDTGVVEAAVAMRLAREQMIRHHLEEAAVIRQLQDQAKGLHGGQRGGMCTVTLKEYVAGGKSSIQATEGQPWWWEVAAASYGMKTAGDGSNAGDSDDGSTESHSDYEQEQLRKRSKSKRPHKHRTQCMRIERYIQEFNRAMTQFASVECFTESELDCVRVTFYGVAAQAQIAAYQLEVAINTATVLAQRRSKAQPTGGAKQQRRQDKATDQVDYMMGYGDGLKKKVKMMAQAHVGGNDKTPPPPPVVIIAAGPAAGSTQGPPAPLAVAQPVSGSMMPAPGVSIKPEPPAPAEGPPCLLKQRTTMAFSKDELKELKNIYLKPAGQYRRRRQAAGNSCRLYWLSSQCSQLWHVLTKDGKDVLGDKWPQADLLYVLRCMKHWELEKMSLGPLPQPVLSLVDGGEGHHSDVCEVIDMTADDIDLTADDVDDITQYAVQLLFPQKVQVQVKAEPVEGGQQQQQQAQDPLSAPAERNQAAAAQTLERESSSPEEEVCHTAASTSPALPLPATCDMLEGGHPSSDLLSPAVGVEVQPEPLVTCHVRCYSAMALNDIESSKRVATVTHVHVASLEEDRDDAAVAGGWGSGACGSEDDDFDMAAEQPASSGPAAAAQTDHAAAALAAAALVEAQQQIVVWQQQSELVAAAVLKEHNIRLRKGSKRAALKRKWSKVCYDQGCEDGMQHQLGTGALPQPQGPP